jgi:signal transduction histidine kinase
MSSIGGRNLVSLVDLTERKRIEEMKDRFMSAVTHELRTPLASIKGYLDLVLSGESGPVLSEVKSNLEVVERNTDRLTSLTDDLLDIQRLQSGKLQVNLEPIDLREVIEHATSEIKPFMKEKKQRFNVGVSKEPLPILGDRVRLSQVLMNLLSNASKFTPEGGEIRLTVRDDEKIVVVKVTDTGIGLRKQDLARVFEPFAAIKKPTHIKGTGLGLSVTKGLIEAHTGRIWAESAGEGKGATFTFALLKRLVK